MGQGEIVWRMTTYANRDSSAELAGARVGILFKRVLKP